MRVAPVRVSELSSRWSDPVVVPRGTGTPAARNAAAFPKCGSATSNVRARSQYAARSGSNTSRSPATSATASWSKPAVVIRQRARARAACDECDRPSDSDDTRSRVRSTSSGNPSGVTRRGCRNDHGRAARAAAARCRAGCSRADAPALRGRPATTAGCRGRTAAARRRTVRSTPAAVARSSLIAGTPETRDPRRARARETGDFAISVALSAASMSSSETVRAEQRRIQRDRERRLGGREQLEAVVVRRHRERDRRDDATADTRSNAASPSCTSRPSNGYTKRCQPSRVFTCSISSSSALGICDHFRCTSSSGSSVSISGPRNTPRPASPMRVAQQRRELDPTAAVDCLPIAESRPSPFGARRTHAFMSRTRTNSSGVPANTNRSPGLSRATKDSSTDPSEPPRRYETPICASPTIVPIDIRCRRAISSFVDDVAVVHERDARVLGIRAQRVATVGRGTRAPTPTRRR